MEARSCRTVSDAIATLDADAAIDWVLLDLMLPDGTGEQVLRHVHQQGHTAEVLVMTGVGDPDRLAQLNAMGPRAILRKPISFDEITAAMGLD